MTFIGKTRLGARSTYHAANKLIVFMADLSDIVDDDGEPRWTKRDLVGEMHSYLGRNSMLFVRNDGQS